jgi:hypothetical protein
LYVNRALAYAALGEASRAVSDFAHACKLDPRHAGAKEAIARNLTVALSKGGNGGNGAALELEAALRSLEAVLRSGPR